MNNPPKLHFRELKKAATVFEVSGWSAEKGLAFVMDANKRRKVISLVLPGLLGGSRLGITFPRVPPTGIEETCLLAPPCRTTIEEAESLRAAAAEARWTDRPKSRLASDLPNWELIWLRFRHEILLTTPEDDAALTARLELFKSERRKDYHARRQELENWRTKTIGQMIILGGGRFYRDLRDTKPARMGEQVEQQLNLLETMFTQPLREFLGRPQGGYLNWTLEVARYEATIRDPVLHDRWARQQKLEIAEIDADKEAFLKWYRTHCPAPKPPASGSFLDVLAPGVRAWSDDMALCAEVRFVVNFPDGSRLWLAECHRRDPLLTVEEQGPFEPPELLAASAGQTFDLTATNTGHVSATVAAAAMLTKAGKQARADVEAGASVLGARTKDLAETLGKVTETFADPLVAAAKDASVKRGVPEIFAWWAFQERHTGKFPTTDGAFRRCGLGPKLRENGQAFSRATLGRWLKIIYEELAGRELMPKRNPLRSLGKARDYDVGQAKDLSPMPGDLDEPPEGFVDWVAEQDAAGKMPNNKHALAYMRSRLNAGSLSRISENELEIIAEQWLEKAVRSLDAGPGGDDLQADNLQGDD